MSYKASFESVCGWCYERICIGDEIRKFIHPVSKQEHWNHEDCTKEAQEEWDEEPVIDFEVDINE